MNSAQEVSQSPLIGAFVPGAFMEKSMSESAAKVSIPSDRGIRSGFFITRKEAEEY